MAPASSNVQAWKGEKRAWEKKKDFKVENGFGEMSVFWLWWGKFQIQVT